MDWHENLEHALGPIFILAMGIGLAFPSQAAVFEPYTILLIGISLFLNFLRIYFAKVNTQARKPALLLYSVFVFLIVSPLLFFFLCQLVYPDAAVGMMLCFAAPTAGLSIFIIRLFKGDDSMGLVLQFAIYLAAPFTFSALVFYMASNSVLIDPFGLLANMLGLLLVPMLAAQALKRVMDVRPIEAHAPAISILVTALFVVGIMGKEAYFIAPNVALLAPLVLLFGVFYLLAALIGCNFAFWLPKKERITLAVSKTFVNGALVFVLASKFFEPKVVLAAMANVIGWYLFLALAKSVNLFERILAVSPKSRAGIGK